MKWTIIGIAVGAFLAYMAVEFGFWAFALSFVFILLGAGVGRAIEGKMDIRGVWDAISGRRSSS